MTLNGDSSHSFFGSPIREIKIVLLALSKLNIEQHWKNWMVYSKLLRLLWTTWQLQPETLRCLGVSRNIWRRGNVEDLLTRSCCWQCKASWCSQTL